MIKINANGLGKLAKHLEKDISRQIPFLYSRVLTESAYEVQKGLKKQISEKLDRPTPFTQKAWKVRKASKQNLRATISLNRIQAQYLQLSILGGKRRPVAGRKSIATIGAGFKTNKYGNYPAKKRISKLLADPKTFVATLKGTYGIWKRVGHKRGALKLLFVFNTEVNYNDPDLKISYIRRRVLKTVNKQTKRIINKELTKLIGKSRVFRS